uniref:LysR substrate-binding domain-containing protein n=1 Tax=Pararhizobium sp. IMCC3301 TaxID=3067904 RepID=UPI00274263D3|nr:LysR substrate-binding domain-containing protein [Pararhizobium sp. IMCC3301]
MSPEIQISQLKSLIAIDEEGSFSAAARRVGRTQSAITQQMRNLELVIGTQLFAAKGRHRELTEAGRTLLRHSHEIVSLCNQAVSASARNQNSGVIRIGAPQEIAEELLLKILKEFSELWTTVRVVVHIDRSPKLMQMLENGELDLSLSTRRSRNYESIALLNMSVHWIAAENWKYNPNDPLPLVLSDEPSMFRRIALSALDLSGQTYIEKVTSSSMSGVRLAVAAEIGITARTKSAFFMGSKTLDEQSGLPPLPDVTYYLHRSEQQSSQASKDLFDMISNFKHI